MNSGDFGVKFFITKGLLITLVGLGLWFSLGLIEASIKIQKSQRLLDAYQVGKASPEELVFASNSLTIDSLFRLNGISLYAEVVSVLHDRESTGFEVSLTEVILAYEKAVMAQPYNSVLWSKYALYLSQSPGQRNNSLLAIDQAEKFGINDYRTLKNLVYYGIREWPRLNCDYRNRMLRHIEAAFRKNDDILMQWNANNRHMTIGKFASALMQYYKFDEQWAKTQALVCQ